MHGGAQLERRSGRSAQLASKSSSSAFWAWRRFSAWSKTADLFAVEDIGGDLLARVGREAVEDDRAVGGGGQQLGVDAR